jgi:NADH-quinone oxidoreductase subunit L
LLHEEHDIFKMGGLWRKLPVVFLTFLAGSASLSALPLVTAGFYSKDQILWFAWSAGNGNAWLWGAGIVGAFITALYSFRMIFIVFFGETKTEPDHKPGILMSLPVVILGVLSLVGGFIELPGNFGHVQAFSNLLKNVLPPVIRGNESVSELIFQLISAVISISGVLLAFYLFFRHSRYAEKINHSKVADFFLQGWGFDKIYESLVVRPVVWLSQVDEKDFIDLWNKGLAKLFGLLNRLIGFTQNGKIRWYAMVLAIGLVVLITILFKS